MQGHLGVLLGAFLEYSEKQIGIDRRTVFKFFIGKYIFAIDQHAKFLAQVGFDLGHFGLKFGV